MQLKHFKNVLAAGAGVSKVTAVAWAPNNTRLAVVTSDRVVHLIDENGERRDKFATKQGDPKNPKNYIVTAMAFSPDSTKLAIAQSDCIVFVYKLGLEWTDKKSISNKFGNATGVTALVWPSAAGGDLVFGGGDGRVRIGQMQDNRPATLFSSGSYVVALATSPAGNAVLSGHVDGSVYLTLLDNLTTSGEVPAVKLFTHSCPPTALAWGAAIAAGGSDGRMSFYDVEGSPLRTFDYSGDASVKDFTVAVASPTGEAVVAGNFSKFMVFALEGGSASGGAGKDGGKAAAGAGGGSLLGGMGLAPVGGAGAAGAAAAAAAGDWREVSVKSVEGLYSVTALGWKGDGSKVAVGSLCGALDLYDACLRRVRYKGKFDFTYVSPSTVIVKRLSSGMRIVLRSSFNYEIARIRVYRDRYMIATTARTLLAGDLESCRLSEVPWDGGAALGEPASTAGAGGRGGSERSRSRPRFYFENPQVAMVYRAGELTLIEYGRTEALGSCRTEYLSPHTVSVRISETPGGGEGGAGASAPRGIGAAGAAGAAAAAAGHPFAVGGVIKVFAYLLDAATARVVDLNSGATLATVAHDTRIDWLELNPRGTMLLFRDKRHRLHLFDCVKQGRATLLPYCNYAQWVPDSDVVVAQRRGTLCVWYSIANPDRVTHYDIRGDVEEIVRGGGKTEVIVDEGVATASYLLDEGLIAFGGAMEAGNFGGATATLEGLELTPETTGMWQQLGAAALAAGDLQVAERAAVALGDTCRARWLRRTAKVAHHLADAAFLMAAGSGAGGEGGAPHHWRVRVPLQQLQGDFAGAEATLLEQGKPEEAVAMYRSLQEWDEALAVAESHGLPEAETLRAQFTEYLLASGQEDRAAALKEREGDLPAAAALYLRGGYPAKAAALVAAHPSAFPRELLERVTAALAAAGMYARAGVLMERLGDSARALESYIRGNAWRQAVELARRTAPARVVELEKGWGDFLMSQRQPEAAVARYIEARAHADAITAAIAARQFARAAELVADTLGSDPAAARPFWRRLAGAAVARGALDEAERFFLQAHEGRSAVDAYLAAGKPEAAYRVARAVMPEGETEELFTSEASRLEAAGSLRQAEKLLLTVGASDAAIAMYSRAKAWDSVLRLVAAHRPGKLKETRLSVAAACAAEGLHRQAEDAFVEAGEWEGAVAMYRTAGMWEDALRVARAGGGAAAAHRVAYAQALSLGPDAGMALLKRLGLIEQAVDFALEMRQWETALELASRHAPDKVLSVHLRRGIALEDEGSFAAAEAEFVAAERPREAIDMYLHLKDWAAALRVAENADPGSVADVLVAQGQAAAAERDWGTAEALLLEAKRPELAVDMYLQARSFPDALRVTKKHLPHRVPEINDRIRRGMAAGEGGSGGVGSPSDSAAASPSAFRDPATRRAAAVAGAYTSSSTALAGGGSGGGVAAQVGRTAAGLRSPLRVGGGTDAPAPSPPGSRGGASGGDPLSAARAWEAEGEFSLAIDSYMAVGGAADETSRDNAACKAAWLRAVSLANEHDARRQYDVCEEVGHRLADAGEHEEAGTLFESLEQLDHAAECFMQAGNWSRARAAAKGAPARIREQVEAAYKAAMTRAGDAESSAAAGALEASLKAYAASGSFDKLFAAAAQAGPGTLATYIYPHVSEHLAAGRLTQAVSALATYGAPPVSTALPIYKRLVSGVFSTGSAGRPLPDTVLQELRDVLYKVTGALRKQAAGGGGAGAGGGASGGDLAVCAEFDRLLLPVHYSALRQRLGRADPATGGAPPAALLELCARLAVSTLRFAGSLIPADRAFFEAGTACQRVGWKGYAFVLLNRYVDICDAVDDAADDDTGRLPAGGVSLARLNNSDFVGTGIPPPAEFQPLAGHWVEARGTRDEIRRWVVEASVVTDAKTSVLPRRPCFSCGDAIFEGSLGCPGCKATFPACVVSGFPIPASQLTACSACGSKAIKGAWNAVVTRTKACPWCSAGGVSAAL